MAKSRRLRGRGVGTSKAKWGLTPEQMKELAEQDAKDAVELDKLKAILEAQKAARLVKTEKINAYFKAQNGAKAQEEAEQAELDKLMADAEAPKAKGGARSADLSRRLAALRDVPAGRRRKSTRHRRQTKRR